MRPSAPSSRRLRFVLAIFGRGGSVRPMESPISQKMMAGRSAAERTCGGPCGISSTRPAFTEPPPLRPYVLTHGSTILTRSINNSIGKDSLRIIKDYEIQP